MKMTAPDLPTSRRRLLSNRTIRITVLLSLVAVATVVTSANSSARLLGQRLIAGAAKIISGVPEAKVTAANHTVAPAIAEAAPQDPSSAMTTGRRGHTATRLSDGRVLIAGGENAGGGYLGQTEIYDPASGAFSVNGSMSMGRSEHAAVKLADGKVLVTGGRTATGPTNTTEVFDPATGTFSTGPAMSVVRTGHSATLLADGRVFVAGGDTNGSAEIFESGAFTAVGPNLNAARAHHSAVLMLDGRVLVVGGRDTNGGALSSMEVFDPADQSFSSIGDLTIGRVLPHLRVLFDGKVQIIGGNNDESMEIYDPVNRELGAYAHVLPATDTCTGLRPGILASQTRAALFHNGQSDALLDRSAHTINELSGSNQALVAGGANSSGVVLDSTSVLASSPASITTDKLDYAPGETANISGRGWQPGETVRLRIHEDPHTPQERGFDIVADAAGRFAGTYLVQDYDLNMKFIVSARGLTSGWNAQTTFTDANNDAHIAPGWAPTNTVTTFSTLYRKTTGGTVQHVRITLPVGYTNISVAAMAFSSGTWSTPVVNQVTRTIDTQLTAGTGLAVNNVSWARIDVTATTPLVNQSGNAAEWLMQTFTNTAGTAGEQNDNPPVLIGNTTSPSATITFVDGGGNPISAPVLQNGVPSVLRVRITQAGSGIKYTDIAVPVCFSSPTAVTLSNPGGNPYNAPLVTDGFIRMGGGDIATNGTLTVTFTTTPNCISGTYLVSSTPSTNAANPPSSTNQSVSTTGGSLTIAAGRADLSITKTDSPDPVTTNGTLTYTINVTNGGPDDASAVKVVDTLPAGVTFVSATGTNWVCNHSSGTVTCNRTGGNLPPGAAPPITITVTAPNTAGQITNTATVSSPNDDTPANNTATATTDVIVPNNAPAGTDNTITTNEDTPYTFAAADFGFTDPNDTPPDAFLAVKITTVATNGKLKLNGVDVTAGQFVPVADINAGNLKFFPDANENGTPYASFTFQVQDDGGTGSGAIDLDQTPNTMTINVNSVNDEPAGTDNTVTTNEDTTYTFTAAEFGFTDPNDTPANTLAAVKITTIATNGKLKLNGVDVIAGQSVPVADINAGKLQFFPDANENGSPYATFTFQVQDNGGTSNGGVDLDQTANTMTVNVNSVNDEPAGADNTVVTNEDTTYTFAAAEFGFTDPNDTPANALAAVKITTIATNGKLKLNGVDVTAGQFIAVADITAGNLKFFPDANENGTPYATFTFQVQDDGGTANGGVDLDQSANTMTVNVTAVNDEPAGADNTVTTNEDTTYTFAAAEFGLTDPNDTPANLLAAVKITTVATNGKLKLNGVDVTAGQFIAVADITAGNLKFFPDANESGTPYASFTFQVQDDGGTANGGVDLDQSANTMTVNVTAVNDEPAGADNTVTTNEDTTYTFAAAEFGFTDPNDTPANALAAVKITTIATNGKLKLNGVDVTAGQFIAVADITAGNLKFFPDSNESGTPYASFTFQVQDDGGTANGGVNLDQSPNTMTINVIAVNDEPAGTDNTVVTNEDTTYTFAAAEFGFTDPNDTPANLLAAVKITTVATNGKLKLNGVDVTAGQFIAVADINAGNLKFLPDANESGTPYASFTFQVQDDGGTANGGVDLDQTANTMTVNVTAVNDEPAGADNTVTTNEDTTYTFAAAEFGFTDPNDTPANALAAVKITTIATNGKLKLNGVDVTPGQFIAVADITAGNLKFFPDANESGTPYASFTFQVQDDGGTANGGVDLDQSPNTMTINVIAVNDEPAGADNTVVTNEDTTYTFAAAEFGFTDPNDTPANALAAVKITTIASNGKLKLNGVDVTPGQFIAVADITAGNLKFFPDANESGTPYASFTFQVQDDGGTANGGVDLDQSANTMTINVIAVNDEPAGTDNTVTTNEDTTYTFAAAEFGFTDPNDTPANALAAVKITTIATNGKVKLNGVDVTAGQFIAVADITAGNLKFFPDANESGTPYASFTFQVQDDGGTANGGVDLDQSPNTMTINVIAVNDEPAGTDNTVVTNEDTTYTFAAAEFGFTDPNDTPANALAAVKITTIASNGKVKLNGVDVTAGQFIAVADINAGNLKFFPDANESGTPYASFTFQVQDDGGTANGGVDLDQSPNTMTINVIAVNDEPAGTDNTVVTNEDTAYTFAAAEFGFTDPNDTPANALAAVKITTVATNGTLTLNGLPVTPGQFVSVADINAGNLKFFPDANESGTPYASFTFQVQDDGGTANGGVDLDQSPNTMTINVIAVNDEPAGAHNTVVTNEDTAYTFAAADFGFTDPNDTPANALAAVKITTITTNGTLTLNGLPVTPGQFVSVADINAGNLKFLPDANESGTPYASFTFQVQDDGGTANGGVDLDQSANTMTINVIAVNDEPAGTDNTVTTNEDTTYTFAAAEFGFTDPNDTPANALAAVKITTITTNGTLTLNGLPVTPGQFASVADINAGNLKFLPDANESGTPYASFTFQVQDDGGTANGGVDLDQSPNTMTINVIAVNDEPAGTDNTVTTNEDTAYTFAAAEFGFTDPNDTPANLLAAVKITTIATNGKVKLNGVDVTPGQFIAVADITAGNLKFLPDANESGTPYASFTFQVQDDGGTANGGVDLDQSPNTMTINVIAVNDEPAGTENTVTTNEDTTYTFATAEFGFTDPNDTPANALAAVKITTIATNGTLTLNGLPVTPGQFVSVADINGGNLKFFPDANENGSPYATFTFQVQDNGGTANGGVDLDQSPNTMTINVAAVNDAPVMNNVTIAPAVINENDSAVLNGSFSDVDSGDQHTVVISWGDGSPDTTLNLAAGVFTFTANHQYKDDNPTATSSDVNTVTVTVCDGGQDGNLATSGDNACAGKNTTITVNNVAPVITTASGPATPQPAGSAVTVTANFTDVGTQDIHACVVNWDDGTTTNGTVTEANGTGTCTASHTYASPGVYSVTVTVTDDDTGSATRALDLQFIVIFDPNAGFVTGGGWIMSPAGACQLNPGCATLTGKANFGFVSKYKKGSNTPDGQTEFQFHAGGINFHSSGYDLGSLVVSGFKAQYRGTGEINGVPGYRFVLTAYDGQVNGGGGIDKFRIKITKNGTVVYDNRIGASEDIDLADPLAISGGSIVIHK